jgi:hypothetical protein
MRERLKRVVLKNTGHVTNIVDSDLLTDQIVTVLGWAMNLERHEYTLSLRDEDEPEHPELETPGEVVSLDDPGLQEIICENPEGDAYKRFGTLVEVIDDDNGVTVSAI